jgi:hypothetical protein
VQRRARVVPDSGIQAAVVYNLFTIIGCRGGNFHAPFLYSCSARGPVQPSPWRCSAPPHRAGKVKFVEAAATPEDCRRRADDDSLSTQAPAWCDVAVAPPMAAGDCWPLFATAASWGAQWGRLVECIGRVTRAEVRASLLHKQS